MRSKLPLMIGAGVLVVALLGVLVVKMAGSERPKPGFATAADPNAPPPMGAVALNTTPSTVAPPSTVAGWVQYKAPDGSFVASFPAAPMQNGQYLEVFGRSMPSLAWAYTTGPDGATYSAEYVDLPTGAVLADSQAGFDELAKDLAISRTDVFDMGNGLSGILFTGKYRDGRDGRGMVVVKGPRLYILSSAGIDDVDFDRFIRSFQLLR